LLFTEPEIIHLHLIDVYAQEKHLAPKHAEVCRKLGVSACLAGLAQ
jgi:hypothetical protein